MPKTYPPEAIEFCFGLFISHNGQNFDAIEREMQREYPGWTKQNLITRDNGRKIGWIEKYGWEAALKIYLSAKGTNLLTSGEKQLQQMEAIRDQLFNQISACGVQNRDLVWQYERYAQRCSEFLIELDAARNDLRDFAVFWKFLLKNALEISPSLARELTNAEDQILKRAKNEFKQ